VRSEGAKFANVSSRSLHCAANDGFQGGIDRPQEKEEKGKGRGNEGGIEAVGW